MVVGEMDKPEIFTDRDGKPQVSMSLKAFNIYFSPFGRPEGSKTESHGSSDSDAPEQTPEPAMQGQGKSAPTFSDDEVPF